MTAWTAAEWKDKKVTIAGLGTFGGQIAAARFFAALGARVTVTDTKTAAALDKGLAQLCGLGARLVLGRHEDEDFAGADLVVASPAIPEASPHLALAARAGVRVTHEMDIFFELCRAPIIAVTGSNGKSTTAALLAHILSRTLGESPRAVSRSVEEDSRPDAHPVAAGDARGVYRESETVEGRVDPCDGVDVLRDDAVNARAGVVNAPPGRPGSPRRVWLGGNIGRSLLLDAAEIAPGDLVVLELSSFQLEDLGALEISPRGAVVTNLSPNHLDRHGTFEAYAAAKRNIAAFQRPEDFLVLNADDPNLAGWEQTAAKVLFFGKLSEKSREGVYLSGRSFVSITSAGRVLVEVAAGWRLRGEHNLMNLAAACAAAGEAGVDLARAVAAAEDFKSLPHRIEYVATVRGVEFFNDSIATTPESAEVGVASFEQPAVLIAGGYDKGADLSGFARRAAERVKALVLIGATAPAIAEAARAANASLPIRREGSLADAVAAAFAAAAPGDAVLMSPACASYDMFNNFEERGEAFRAEVRRLAQSKE